MEKINNLIKKYPTIIIHRHIHPDYDALGSQIGLKKAIKEMYKEKDVYVVGEMNNNEMLGKMDIIDDSLYEEALVIILDVSTSKLVSDVRYKLAKEIVIIDHHDNECDILGYLYVDKNAPATAEIVAEFVYKYLKINEKGATALLSGIISDTGRFLYSQTNANTFLLASKLLDSNADIQSIYNTLYIETIEERKMKRFFSGKYILEEGIAYMKNDVDIYEYFDVSARTISRKMVNVMSGIKDVLVWANFTYDKENKVILCALRSRNIPLVDVARKYGGGGHKFACGTSVSSWETVDCIIKDIKERRALYD